MRKLLALLLSAAAALSLAACTSSGASSSQGSSSDAPESASSGDASLVEPESSSSASGSTVSVPELSLPQGERDTDPDFAAKVKAAYEGTGEFAGNPTVTIETSMGAIKIRLFPEQAPKAVENFLTHAKDGYYDGLKFHRVINDFMIQGGDPLGNGTGGESIFGAPFEDEFSDYLHNFRGALSMANSGPGTNGSQFFIVQNPAAMTQEQWDAPGIQLMSIYMNLYVNHATALMDELAAGMTSNEDIQALVNGLNEKLNEKQNEGVPAEFKEKMAPVYEIYAQVGGTPYLDYKHTVFGYVYEGMDIVDKIAAVETENDAPKEDITITKITVNE